MSEHTDWGVAFVYRRIISRCRKWKMLASSHFRIAMTRIYVWEILPKFPAVSLRSALLLTRQFQEKRSRQNWQLEQEQTIATLGYQAPPKSSENRIKDYEGYCWLSLPSTHTNICQQQPYRCRNVVPKNYYSSGWEEKEEKGKAFR